MSLPPRRGTCSVLRGTARRTLLAPSELFVGTLSLSCRVVPARLPQGMWDLSSPTRYRTLHCKRILNHWTHQGNPRGGLIFRSLGKATKKRRCPGSVMERKGRDAHWSWREAIPQVRGDPGPSSPCEAPPGDAQLGAPWPRGQCPGEGLSGQVWGEWRRQPHRLGRQMLKGLGHTVRLVDRATPKGGPSAPHPCRPPTPEPRSWGPTDKEATFPGAAFPASQTGAGRHWSD